MAYRDEVQGDHGRDFYLLLYVQEQLCNEGIGDSEIHAVLTSKQAWHHTIFYRVKWVLVNQKITYPIEEL